MPKDKNLSKHKSRFEVRGGVINEFDFHNNQGAMAVEERDRFARQEEEQRLREGEAEAAGQPAGKGATSSTKKSSTKKARTKAGTKKAVGTKKGAAGQATAKKGGAKKNRAGTTRKASRAR